MVLLKGEASHRCPKIPQEEHLVDVRKSANIGHLRDENHLIDVHLAEMWAPNKEEEVDNDDDDNKEEVDDNTAEDGVDDDNKEEMDENNEEEDEVV